MSTGYSHQRGDCDSSRIEISTFDEFGWTTTSATSPSVRCTPEVAVKSSDVMVTGTTTVPDAMGMVV